MSPSLLRRRSTPKLWSKLQNIEQFTMTKCYLMHVHICVCSQVSLISRGRLHPFSTWMHDWAVSAMDWAFHNLTNGWIQFSASKKRYHNWTPRKRNGTLQFPRDVTRRLAILSCCRLDTAWRWFWFYFMLSWRFFKNINTVISIAPPCSRFSGEDKVKLRLNKTLDISSMPNIAVIFHTEKMVYAQPGCTHLRTRHAVFICGTTRFNLVTSLNNC
jgi:hypothetical protein